MESGKKTGSKSEFAARAFGILGLAAAMAILVLVPAVLDTDMLMDKPAVAYHTMKFQVLMVLSGVLLVATLGFVVFDRGPLRVPVLFPALAYLGVSGLSTLFSQPQDRMYTLTGDRADGLLTVAAGVLLFYAMARVLDSPFRIRLFLAAGVTSAVLISVFGIAQNYGLDMLSGWVFPWYTDIGRSFSTVGNPLTLAAYLTLMMGAAVALSFKAGSLVGRVPWLLALAVIAVCWTYTDARGALLGVGAALPVVLWLAHRRMGTAKPLLVPLATAVAAMAVAIGATAAFGNLSVSVPLMAVIAAYLVLLGAFVLWISRRGTGAAPPDGDHAGRSRRERSGRRRLLVSLGVLAAVAALAIGAWAALGKLPLPNDRIAAGERPKVTTAEDERGLASVEIRVFIWRETIPLILDRPLLGHGPDNFGRAFYRNTDEDSKAFQKKEYGQIIGVDRAHNDLLQVAATTGLLGLAAYVWIYASYFRNSYRRGGWPLTVLSGAVLAYILQLQTLFSIIDTNVAFWGLLGASVAVMRLRDRETAAGEETESGVATALTAGGAPRAKVDEILTVLVVAGILAVIAVPAFLEQREKTAEAQRERVVAEVNRTVLAYKLVKLQTGSYPEAGVYTQDNPIEGKGFKHRPPGNIKVTTTTSPNGYTVEGESTSLSSNFRQSYDSTTDKYTPPLPPAPRGDRQNPSRQGSP